MRRAGTDIVGIFLNLCVILFAIYPYFLTLFGIYFEIDPFIIVYKYWFPAEVKENIGIYFQLLFHCCRIVLTFIPFLFGCRTICLIICLSTTMAHLLLACVFIIASTVQRISILRSATSILHKHKALEIIMVMSDEIVSFEALGFMGLGLVLGVLFNFVSLKLYHTIPMPLFLYFPSVSVLIICVILVMLPLLINFYENDVQIHAQWRYYCYCRRSNFKIITRLLKATKVVRFNAGIPGFKVYELKKGVKPIYLFTLVNYTITALLSIPVNM